MKSKWIIPIILIVCDPKIYPAPSTLSNDPFVKKEELNKINKKSSFSELSGTFREYQPFEKSNYSGSQLNSNALKAPDGPPINGVPIYDSLITISLMAIIYGVIKKIKRRYSLRKNNY